MQKRTWIVVVTFLALAVIASIPFARRPKPSVQVKAYFASTVGLKPGAFVRMSGVEIGSVTGVLLHPKQRDNPVEVTIALSPKYAVDIPNDSIASLSTEGVLGPAFVSIDSRSASGPPLQNGGTLRTIPVESLTPEQFLKRMSEAITKNRAKDAQH